MNLEDEIDSLLIPLRLKVAREEYWQRERDKFIECEEERKALNELGI